MGTLQQFDTGFALNARFIKIQPFAASEFQMG